MLQIPGVPNVSKRLARLDSARLAASFLILIVIALSFFVFSKSRRASTFTIESGQNNFKLSFNLSKNDDAKLSQFLEKLSLPQSVKQGAEFALDATSSAKLAFAAPLKGSFKVDDNTFNFQGTLKRSQNQGLAFENIKIPVSSSVAILSQDFKDFLTKNLQPPPQFTLWARDNLTSQAGQYLIVFGQDNDFAIIFKNNDLNLQGLKDIKDSSGQPIHKEETVDGQDLILLKFTSPSFSQDKTPAIFSQGDWHYFVSSAQGARDLLESLKSPEKLVDFPNLPPKDKPSLVIDYVSQPDTPAPAYFFQPQGKLSAILKNLERARFVLQGSSFSGQISVK